MAVDNWLPKPIDGKETGKMEAPLKAVDIRDTLNAYGGNVSNKTTSFFKSEANINKWSKHKPIVDSRIFVPFDDEVWDSQDGDVPRVYTHSNLYNEDVLKEVWNGCSEDAWFQYVLPAGGQSQPLRKGDFRGYRADATSPFKSFSNSESIDPISGNVSFQLYIRFYLNDESEPIEGGMMSLFDIAEFDQVANYKVAVIDKYTRPDGYGNTTYTPYFSKKTLAETGWGLQEVGFTLGKVNNTNEGIHEFAVALTDGVDYYYKLPFEHIKLEAEIFYVKTTVVSSRGEVTATYHYDTSTGKKIYDSITVTLWATFVRGSEDNAETEILADFGIGTENYNDAGFNMPDVRFTIPDSGTGSQPKKEVKSTKTFTSADGTNFINLSTYYDAQTLVGYIGSEVIQLTY